MSTDPAITREVSGNKGRYVIRQGADEAELTYSVTSPVLVIADHTFVPDAFRGTGAGLAMLTRLVADARTEGTGRWRTYETGTASWYGGRWHGRKTANGERYDQYSMTAAHKKLPFNTKVRVTNLSTGKSCIVRINNRGPYVRGRVIDLSVAAAKKIGSYSGGLSRVKLEVER